VTGFSPVFSFPFPMQHMRLLTFASSDASTKGLSEAALPRYSVSTHFCHHCKYGVILYLKYTARSVERMASSRTFTILEYSSGETLARI